MYYTTMLSIMNSMLALSTLRAGVAARCTTLWRSTSSADDSTIEALIRVAPQGQTASGVLPPEELLVVGIIPYHFLVNYHILGSGT